MRQIGDNMVDETRELVALPIVPIIDESIIPEKGPSNDDPLEHQFPVVEMFHSIQGEGYHSGKASIFIRFGGCNLACSWCDTKFDEWENMTLREIIRNMERWDCNRIVLTGGEPALQDLKTLSSVLRPLGYLLTIETNGTITIDEGLMDWICVSPKDQMYPSVKIRQIIGDELKVVWVGQDLSMYDEIKNGFTYHFIQPCYDESKNIEWNGNNFRETFELVKSNPEWCLSLQTHKWMGVD